MSEQSRNLWAPWRMKYIEALGDQRGEGCFLCRYREAPQEDAANHVLHRGKAALVVLNSFPYTSGHLLVAPAAHAAQLEALPDDLHVELALLLRDAKRVLDHAYHPQGFNIGMNLGPCAGAGLPDHLHWHIVPRWGGDTNFMAVIDNIRVIPEALEDSYRRLSTAAAELGVWQSS